MGAALGSCVLTLMAIQAKALRIDVSGMKAEVSKEMAKTSPRRIEKLTVIVTCPHQLSEEIRGKLEKAGKNCPVHYSLHPEIIQDIIFRWSV